MEAKDQIECKNLDKKIGKLQGGKKIGEVFREGLGRTQAKKKKFWQLWGGKGELSKL